VHAAEEHQGEIVTMLVDHLVEIVRPDGVLAGPGPDDDQVAFRVETVMAELRLDHVSIGRERRRIDEDPSSLPGGSEERRKQEMEVDAQRVRRRDFGGLGPDQPTGRTGEVTLDIDPWLLRVEPAVDTEAGPRVEPFLDRGARVLRLGSQALPGEVRLGSAVTPDRQSEAVTEAGGSAIRGIAPVGVCVLGGERRTDRRHAPAGPLGARSFTTSWIPPRGT